MDTAATEIKREKTPRIGLCNGAYILSRVIGARTHIDSNLKCYTNEGTGVNEPPQYRRPHSTIDTLLKTCGMRAISRHIGHRSWPMIRRLLGKACPKQEDEASEKGPDEQQDNG
jgi:hypothetical protein